MYAFGKDHDCSVLSSDLSPAEAAKLECSNRPPSNSVGLWEEARSATTVHVEGNVQSEGSEAKKPPN